jgi:hypothetical protein
MSVEVAGIEPASVGAEPGLLRAQSAVAFLSPGDHADEFAVPGSAAVQVPSEAAAASSGKSPS